MPHDAEKKRNCLGWFPHRTEFFRYNGNIIPSSLGIFCKESFPCSHHKTSSNYVTEKRSMLLPPKSVSIIPEIQKWLAAAKRWPSHNRPV